MVLSHVLGVELQRDGCSEFLCGKCVFLLERVVRCDVAIEQLQETHAAQLQRLQKERDGLKTQITNKYRQYNPTKLGGNTSQKPLKQEVQTGASLRSPKQLVQRPQLVQPKRQARADDVQDISGRSQGLVSVGNDRQEKFKSRLRRCVSLEPLSRIGTDRSHHLKLNSCSRQSSDTRSGTPGGPVARPRSLSRDYLDVVHKKSALISRSTSLQSVALEQYDHALISASPFKQTRPLKNSTPRTVETTTVVFDILQLLKSVQRVQPIPHCNGSKIPVLYTRGNAHRAVSWKSRVERSLREMEEEFNDDYTPLKQEVHCSYSGCEILMTLCLLKQ